MPKTGNMIAGAFLVIIIAISSAIMLPELFANLVNQQTSGNQAQMQIIRILIMVFIVFAIGGAISLIVGDTDV